MCLCMFMFIRKLIITYARLLLMCPEKIFKTVDIALILHNFFASTPYIDIIRLNCYLHCMDKSIYIRQYHYLW